MDGEIVERTVRATVREIEGSRWRGRRAKTVFFGGGTPTFLSAEQLTRILRAVVEVHPLVDGAEVSSEANPGTVDAEKFAAMREAGFNRLSIGAQSFQTGELLQLGRIHAASDVARAVGLARRAGFENLNLDMMFALPGQSERVWRSNLEIALSLRPEHLSLYCLTIEPNTRFYKYYHRGLIDLPDDEAQVRMYDLACALVRESGYEQYEISNFALPGRRCEHNLCYWHGEEYLAYGPGAVGCFDEGGVRTRYTDMKGPKRYCEAIEEGTELWCESEELDSATQAFERWMMGLRLNDGVEMKNLSLDGASVKSFKECGWLDETCGKLRLTGSGRHFCNEVTVGAWAG